MKIAGTRGCITFDLENGYVIKAQGGIACGREFLGLEPHNEILGTAPRQRAVISEPNRRDHK